jgi:hypothetical protein
MAAVRSSGSGPRKVAARAEGRELVAGTTVNIEFDDGRVSVSAGCNIVFGPYDVTDGTWPGPVRQDRR